MFEELVIFPGGRENAVFKKESGYTSLTQPGGNVSAFMFVGEKMKGAAGTDNNGSTIGYLWVREVSGESRHGNIA